MVNKMYKVINSYDGSPKYDYGFGDRVIHNCKMVLLLRLITNPDRVDVSVRSLLPTSAKCVVSETSLRKRLFYLFQHSLKDKCLNVLEDAHLPLFSKAGELTRQLMMCGLPPPFPVDPTQFG